MLFFGKETNVEYATVGGVRESVIVHSSREEMGMCLDKSAWNAREYEPCIVMSW